MHTTYTGASAPHCATTHDARKRFATLQALAARRGYELREIDGSNGRKTYRIFKWNLTHELVDLAAADRFIDQLGAGDD